MDITMLKTKTTDFFRKYWAVAVVLLLGVLLMLLPGGDEEETETKSTQAQTDTAVSVNEELANILSQIEGAGDVQVLLTIAAGEQTVYQTDEKISVSSDSTTTQIDTITITDADRNEVGLVRQVNPPTYLGALIVCQGADSAAVRLAIVEAVSKVTGLGADRISVLKMK